MEPSLQELHYERPSTLVEAIALLAKDGAKALAGGTDLIPQLREGRRSAGTVVDLKHIPALTSISATPDGGWRIGAAVSVSALARHTGLAAALPGLAEAACLIGSLQVQSRATLGGNICNAAPSADAVPMLIALGAAAIVSGPGSERHLPVEAVAAAPGRTSLASGEIVTAVLVPPRSARSAGRYLRMTPRREMDIAVAGAAACISLDDSGVIASARIALASVAPTPVRTPSAEAALIGQTPGAIVFRAAGLKAAADAKPISDTRGSDDYRRELVAVLTRRALERCAADLGLILT